MKELDYLSIQETINCVEKLINDENIDDNLTELLKSVLYYLKSYKKDCRESYNKGYSDGYIDNDSWKDVAFSGGL